MSTLTFLDGPGLAFFHRDPAERINDALCEFCAWHRIPGEVTARAINLAHAYREKGHSVAASIQHGKTQVRLWLSVNDPTPPRAA